MSHCTELQFIYFIQQMRNPPLDAFFKFLNFFDRQEFFFVLIPALWLGKGWKTGMRLFYILSINSLVNHALKGLFSLPRPFHLDSSVGLLPIGGYGLPSGAAQTVILLSGILLSAWKSRWKWAVAFCYVFLISLSRLYLGVHFPTDILAGWTVGFMLWLLYAYARPPLESRLVSLCPLSLFLLSQLVPLLLFFWQYSLATARISGCAMGLGAGVFLNYQCRWPLPSAQTIGAFALRALIGIAGTFTYYFLLPLPHAPWIRLLQFFILGLWIATGALLICRILLKNSRTS